MAESPFGKRITLAEAITWIAYRQRAKFKCESIRAKMRTNHSGFISTLPSRMYNRLEQAGRQLIAWMSEGRIRAGGHPYEFRGVPVISGEYVPIPADFLRSGVYCEAATDLILTDPTIGEKWGQFVHERTYGFAMVTIDERDLAKCLSKKAPSRPLKGAQQKKGVGAPKGSNEIDDSVALEKAEKLLTDGCVNSVLAAANQVSKDTKDIDRIRKKLAKRLQNT